MQLLTLPNAVTPPPVAESVVTTPSTAGANSVAAQTFQAVASQSSAPSVLNNRRNAAIIPPSTGSMNAVLSPLTSSGTTVSSVAQLRGGMNSGFLAQLAAQGQTALLNAYATPDSLVPNPALLERFSLTKYLPSRAFVPAPPPQNVAEFVQQQPVRDVPQPRVSEQPKEAAVPREVMATPVQPTQPPVATQTAEPVRSAFNETSKRTDRPTLRSQGFGSYLATFSRNIEFINPVRFSSDPLTA